MTLSKQGLTSKAAAHDDLVEMLAHVNCDARLVERTRRATRAAALAIEEHRIRQRHAMGVAVLAVLSLLVILSPVLWGGMEDLAGGEHFADLSLQLEILFLMLFPAMLASLIIVWKGHHNAHRDRHGW